MADATDSKSVGSNTVWVQVPYPAPIFKELLSFSLSNSFYFPEIYLFINIESYLHTIFSLPIIKESLIKLAITLSLSLAIVGLYIVYSL